MQFKKLTKRCLIFILKRKINVLVSGDTFNHNEHIGLEIEGVSNHGNKIDLDFFGIPHDKDKSTGTDEKNKGTNLHPAIVDLINRIKASSKKVMFEDDGKFYLDVVSVNEKIYKMKMPLIKVFLKVFLDSEYCIDNIIQSHTIDGKKRQVIYVTENFVAFFMDKENKDG